MRQSSYICPQDDKRPHKWLKVGHQNFATMFPSLKNGRPIYCESKLEADYCIWLEFDCHVEKYVAQPHTFKWSEMGKTLRYTPDFLVKLNHAPPFYCEVKPSFSKLRTAQTNKLLYFADLCRDNDWHFQHADSHGIYGPATFPTIRSLYSRCGLGSEVENFNLMALLRTIVFPITLGEVLRDDRPASIGAICQAIFYGKVQANLTQPLTLDFVLDGLAKVD